MFRHPPLATDWIDRPHLRLALGDLALESGEVLRDAFVSYVIHGDAAKLPHQAILATTAIGSTHHRLDFLIGPGAAIDCDRYCVVVADALGNGLSSSPSNSPSQPRDRFPRFTIRDMVESQRRLLDHLGVGKLVAVIGASMGGMQALQWGVSHPDRMHSIIAMTPMARSARWSQLVNELSRRALFEDSLCQVPRSRNDAMRLWVPLTQLAMPRTPRALEEFPTQHALLAWLDDRAALLADAGPDPFDWCFQTWAYDAHDVGGAAQFGGDTIRALQHVRAATLVLAPSSDLYNPAFSARAVSSAIAGARFVELPGSQGHASASGLFAAPTAVLCEAVRAFIARIDP